MLEYGGYTGVVEFDPHLRRFTGHVVDLRDEIYFEGDTVAELEASMRRAVDHYLVVCEKRGETPERPYSGKLMVRTSPSVHRAVALAAVREHRSMNEWVEKKLAEAAGVEG